MILWDGIYRLIMSDEPLPVNIGNPGEFTMRELAEKVLAITGSASEIVTIPQPFADDPRQRKPDISKARKVLGWEPTIRPRHRPQKKLSTTCAKKSKANSLLPRCVRCAPIWHALYSRILSKREFWDMAESSQKRALITGITGQDGSYLAEFLLDKGYEVFGVVRRSSTETFERIQHIKERVTLMAG